jgi:nitrite reductase (NADH) large subunit
VHTGARLGSKSNLALSLCFLGAAAVGAYASTLIAREHRLGINGVELRRNYIWLHILVSWPLPALLIFHVLKSYYF